MTFLAKMEYICLNRKIYQKAPMASETAIGCIRPGAGASERERNEAGTEHSPRGDFLFVREAARAGAGIALMDSLFAEKDVVDGRLVCLLPRYSVKASGLYLVYPATRHVPRKVTAFRDLLLEVIQARTASRRGKGG
jgi:DNA-binding transcriptional LysR family regulator